jgi:hypothetical protein
MNAKKLAFQKRGVSCVEGIPGLKIQEMQYNELLVFCLETEV